MTDIWYHITLLIKELISYYTQQSTYIILLYTKEDTGCKDHFSKQSI